MNLDTFLAAYIESALWSSYDDDSNPLEDNFSHDDIAPETLAGMREDCEKFIADNAEDLRAYAEQIPYGDWTAEDLAGHDFWLTRNHHGSGFWDLGLGDLGDRLTEAAHAFPQCDLYAGDDGRIYA